MGKLIFAINMSADGYCGHEIFNPDGEVHDYFTGMTRQAGAMLYGRKTYELMVPFWPDMAKDNSGETEALNRFARIFTETPKIVFSSTMAEPEDANTRIERGNLKEAVLRLKEGSGDILTGGVSIPSQLAEMGLIDEFRFVVHPVLAGEGRKLLEGIVFSGSRPLHLIDRKVFSSGSVALHYAKGNSGNSSN